MILDTNALSAFAEGVSSVVQQVADADELHVPVIVLGEYRFGIATSRRRREYEACGWTTRNKHSPGSQRLSRSEIVSRSK